MEKPKENKDILNTATFIMISYLTKDKSLTIKENSDFWVTFPDILMIIKISHESWINIRKQYKSSC